MPEKFKVMREDINGIENPQAMNFIISKRRCHDLVMFSNGSIVSQLVPYRHKIMCLFKWW